MSTAPSDLRRPEKGRSYLVAYAPWSKQIFEVEPAAAAEHRQSAVAVD